MAKIIEISGPAGAGKSTILNELEKNWKESSDWIFYQKLLPYQKVNFLKVSSLISNMPSYLKNGKTNLDTHALYEAGRRFINQNGKYIDMYWENLNNNYSRDFNGYDGRFDSSAKFHHKIQEYQYMKEYKIDKYIFFEEGLIHNLTGRVPIKNDTLQKDKVDIEAFIQVMPLPDILMLIDTDIETILERLTNRRKVLAMHKNKSVQVLRDLTLQIKERMEYAKEILISRGVNVLSIDSKEDVNQNTKKIISFISQLKVI